MRVAKTTKTLAPLIGALLLCLGIPSVAQANDYSRSGAYLGVGGVAGIDVDHDDDQGSGEILVGYRFAPFFGGDLDVQVGSFSIVRVVGQAKIYPVSSFRVQPYFLLGVGTWIYPDDAGALGLLRPGVGVDVYLTRHVVVAPTVYYEMIFSAHGFGTPSVVYVGGTLQYRF
jgi:hypothetical protein